MSLELQAKHVRENFLDVTSTEFLNVLNQIQEKFLNKITQEYLQGKLKAITQTSNEEEKKKMCKNLIPYLDWYLQGL